MKKAPALTLAIAGLALATGCGADNVVGGQAPLPGVAAEVEGATLELDDLEVLTDAICASLDVDATATPTSRARVQVGVVAQWVSAEVARELVADEGISVEPEPAQVEQIPGWDDFSEEERAAITDYVDTLQYLRAAGPEVGDEEGSLDTSGVEVTINPRYDLDAEEAIGEVDLQTSVAVSDEALAGWGSELTPQQVADLPDGQRCGSTGTTAPAPQ